MFIANYGYLSLHDVLSWCVLAFAVPFFRQGSWGGGQQQSGSSWNQQSGGYNSGYQYNQGSGGSG